MRAAKIHDNVVPVAALGIELVDIADCSGGERSQLQPVPVVQRQIDDFLIVDDLACGGVLCLQNGL